MKGGLQYHRSFLYVGISSFLLGALWWGGTMKVEAVVNLNTFLAPGHMINLTYGNLYIYLSVYLHFPLLLSLSIPHNYNYVLLSLYLSLYLIIICFRTSTLSVVWTYKWPFSSISAWYNFK